MKNTNLMKRLGFLILASALLVSVFTGCSGSAKNSAAPASSAAPSASSAKIKVSVGIGNAFNPFCYLDEKDKIDGYDYQTMLEIAKLLSDKYDFQITPDAFANLLIGLDTKKYDIAIHHFGYTDARAKTYLYAKVPNMYSGSFHIGYKTGRTDITDMKSLTGKTVITGAGSLAESLVVAWNTANPGNKIELAYSTDKAVWYSGINSGLYDAYIATDFDLDTMIKQYGNFMAYDKNYSVPMGSGTSYNPGTYFIYKQGSDQLQQDIDKATQTLLDNGTLSKLSMKYLGADYTKDTFKK